MPSKTAAATARREAVGLLPSGAEPCSSDMLDAVEHLRDGARSHRDRLRCVTGRVPGVDAAGVDAAQRRKVHHDEALASRRQHR